MAKAGLIFAKRDEWYTPIEVFQTFGSCVLVFGGGGNKVMRWKLYG